MEKSKEETKSIKEKRLYKQSPKDSRTKQSKRLQKIPKDKKS